MKLVRVTPAAVQSVGQNLRRQDQIEVWASDRLTGPEAVELSWRRSEVCCCICADDQTPVGLCGVSGNLIWLLATDGLLASPSSRRQFIHASRKWVDSLFDDHGYDYLHNWTLGHDTPAVRWLRWLGFTVEAAEPMGPSLRLFSHFWRAR